MSIKINSAQLAEIVNKLLTERCEATSMDDHFIYKRFMTSLAEMATKVAGGKVLTPAMQNSEGLWEIAIHRSSSSPTNGGVWAQYESTGSSNSVEQITWSGSSDPTDPDNFWIDDETGDRICAKTGERTHSTTTKQTETSL